MFVCFYACVTVPKYIGTTPRTYFLRLVLQVHHLLFSCCVPLLRIAEWFANLTDHVLVEFVPTDDPMVQKLLKNRLDEHLPYNLEVFRSSFGEFFDFLDQTILNNGRTLFLCRRRKG